MNAAQAALVCFKPAWMENIGTMEQWHLKANTLTVDGHARRQCTPPAAVRWVTHRQQALATLKSHGLRDKAHSVEDSEEEEEADDEEEDEEDSTDGEAEEEPLSAVELLRVILCSHYTCHVLFQLLRASLTN